MTDDAVRSQLMNRRQKLFSAMAVDSANTYLSDLLDEVDAALSRMDRGTFGLCEVCLDPIETDRLAADPLVRLCLDHLTPAQQRDLEQDLALAASIQNSLLPRTDLARDGWRAAYHYQPAGPVSGDYCDLVKSDTGELYFMLGDVSGKGVAASMLMAQLHATFRALIGVGLPLVQLVERASRIFCENTLASQYATLVCGKAGKTGDIEICNAGHPPPLLVTGSGVKSIAATGLPLGLFCGGEFLAERIQLAEGDRLVLYTDGLSEATDSTGKELGIQELANWAKTKHGLPAEALLDSLLSTTAEFRSSDDRTILVLERSAVRGH